MELDNDRAFLEVGMASPYVVGRKYQIAKCHIAKRNFIKDGWSLLARHHRKGTVSTTMPSPHQPGAAV